MGLADVRATRVSGVEQPLKQALIPQLRQLIASLEIQVPCELNHKEEIELQEEVIKKVNLKYEGTSSIFTVDFTSDVTLMQHQFETEHKSRYGFIQTEKLLIIESISVEVIQKMGTPEEPVIIRKSPVEETPQPVEIVKIFTVEKWDDIPVYLQEDLQPEDSINGAVIIVEKSAPL